MIRTFGRVYVMGNVLFQPVSPFRRVQFFTNPKQFHLSVYIVLSARDLHDFYVTNYLFICGPPSPHPTPVCLSVCLSVSLSLSLSLSRSLSPSLPPFLPPSQPGSEK